jgi:hypothetical protein
MIKKDPPLNDPSHTLDLLVKNTYVSKLATAPSRLKPAVLQGYRVISFLE